MLNRFSITTLIPILGGFLLYSATPGLAVEWGTKTTARMEWSADNDGGKRGALQASVVPEVVFRFDNGAKLTAVARLRANSLDALGPDSITREAYDDFSRPLVIGSTTEVELRELYLEHTYGNYDFTLGKQHVVWGKADGLKVLDIVNPQSFSQFILEDFEDSRIPQWTLNVETRLDDWDTQFLWIPDQSYNVLPNTKSLYAITTPRMVPWQLVPGALVTVLPADRPSRVVADSDWGLRLSRFWNGWDLTFNYLYQYDNFPALKRIVSPTIGVGVTAIQPEFLRTHVLGSTFSNAMGNWVWRGELGYFTNRAYLSSDPLDSDGRKRGNELSYVLGGDWTGLRNTFVSGQVFQSRLHGVAGLSRDKTETNASLLVRRTLLNEMLLLQLLWLINTDNDDGLVRLKASYELSDDLRIWLANDAFYGSSNGIFGQFSDNDRFNLGIEISF